ncbi:MAG: DUF924 family protein [Burkholderiaceae bacterium]
MSNRAQEILDFWFGEQTAPAFGQPRKDWFVKSEAFDEQIREQFEPDIQAALAGQLENWHDNSAPPQTCLAYILLLDQFTRNVYRNTPAMVSGDARALAAAQSLVASGRDKMLTALERVFVYLPYEHAEDMPAQHESLRLFASLPPEPNTANFIDYARQHFDVVARFGRFPHRNAWLGRNSTPEEEEFLKQPGSGF